MLSSQDVFYNACKSGDLFEINRVLNEKGVDATAWNNLALRWAAECGHLPVVNRLLGIKEVDATAYNNNHAICWAASNGHLDVVDRLLGIEGIDATALDNRALRWAAQYGHLDVVDRLLGIEGVDATACNNDALRSAARNGHLAVVNRLLKIEGVDATADDNDALRWAARNGHLAVVNRLLKVKEVDATADDNYALRSAAEYGHLAVVARLLKEPNVLLGNELLTLEVICNLNRSIQSLVFSMRPSIRTEYKKKYPNDYQALLAWRSDQRYLGGYLRRAGLLHKDIVSQLCHYLPDSSQDLIKEGFERVCLKFTANAKKESIQIELASGSPENRLAKNNPKDAQQGRGHSCFSGLLGWMSGTGPQDKSKSTEQDTSEEQGYENTQTHKRPYHYK